MLGEYTRYRRCQVPRADQSEIKENRKLNEKESVKSEETKKKDITQNQGTHNIYNTAFKLKTKLNHNA